MLFSRAHVPVATWQGGHRWTPGLCPSVSRRQWPILHRKHSAHYTEPVCGSAVTLDGRDHGPFLSPLAHICWDEEGGLVIVFFCGCNRPIDADSG